METNQTASDRSHEGALKLRYNDLVSERDRLRDAQRAVTSQLGPIPASTSVILGLLAALATNDESSDLARVAIVGLAVVFAVLITGLSLYWSGGEPYRELRREALRADEENDKQPEQFLSEPEWLERRIALEERLYEKLAARYDEQRRHLFWIQGLLLAEAVVLLSLAVAFGVTD